ncbi:hypothetical protein CHS0354_001407 [Potamilus streckersoni]|uniref:Uncharacterized protein n=1 Tax=Potamilus streckersoni TaxID=2493646 RepID=A0AAE0T7Q2_9BIVA|nr:hypothetical protein CHS0354_001407 [Potamilus streckersoni]
MKKARGIEKQTRMQSKNTMWFQKMELFITDFRFGTFCKLKETTDFVKILTQKKCSLLQSVKHDIRYESVTLAKYCPQTSVIDSEVGLIINPKLQYLGISPDRLVMENEMLKLFK